MKERAYVVTGSIVHDDKGRGSNALTRDAIRLEIAMRLTIDGEKVRRAWDTADEFVREMDDRLPKLMDVKNDGGWDREYPYGESKPE
jgi:hypothetical protein